MAAAIACFTAAGAFAGALACPSTRLAPQAALVRDPDGGAEVQPAPQGTASSALAAAGTAAASVKQAATRPMIDYESMSSIGEIAAGAPRSIAPCGAGPALRAVPPSGEVRYIAADLSPSMLRRARRRAAARGLEIEFLEADAAELPLPTASADLFLSYWGLHCFDDPAAALTEAARLLKPGGRLVGSCFVAGRDGWRQRLLVRPANGGFGRQIGTQPEVESWLAAAGLETTATRRSGPMFFFDARRA